MFIPKNEKLADISNYTAQFPIIRTGNLDVDNAINTDLKNRFTDYEYLDLSTENTLMQWAEPHLFYLDFKVTYIKNGLISLHITAEGCGAYCTTWTSYYTYSLTTGKYVTLKEIVDISGKFNDIVVAQKDKQYEEQKAELKKMQLNSASELGEDVDIYPWALEYYENCDQDFELSSFALYPDYLEIIETCYLPNTIKSLTPIIELKYQYADIQEFLKIKY